MQAAKQIQFIDANIIDSMLTPTSPSACEDDVGNDEDEDYHPTDDSLPRNDVQLFKSTGMINEAQCNDGSFVPELLKSV